MHLEADRRDQPVPMDSALEIPPDLTIGHYTAELMRWMEMEGQENPPADIINHDPNTLNQLKLERSCLYIASKNIREELEDTIRAIAAQENELIRQREEKTEMGRIGGDNAIRHKTEKSGAKDTPGGEEGFAIFANNQVGTYRRRHEAVVLSLIHI